MRYFVTILLCCLCAPALADDASDRAMLAQRLADLLEIRAQYDQARNSCRQSDAALEKAMVALYTQRPADFGGISPKSAYWPQARKFYREYLDSECEMASGDKLEPLFVKQYAATLSVADLRAAEQFHASPAGRAMQAANRTIFRNVTERLYRRAAEDREVATAIFPQSMVILKSQYRANPR